MVIATVCFMLAMLALFPCNAFAQVHQPSEVRAVCTEDALLKNFESNEVLSDVLDKYYQSFERQFRVQAQRAATVEFFYDGSAGNKAAIWFKAGNTVAYSERASKCDAEIGSFGEIRALGPYSFQVTLTLLVNRVLNQQESRLSEAEKSNLAMIWKYKSVSPPFPKEKLDYAAHGDALKAAFAFAEARLTQPRAE
jgi:hypothetical protein